MFATVEFYERKKGIREKLKSFLGGEKITAEKVNLPENEYFYRLKVPVYNGRIPSEGLKKISSSFAEGLIFPVGFYHDRDIRAYSSSYFRDLILFNSAVRWLEKGDFISEQTTVTLIDKRAVLHTQAERLVPLAGEVRIITENPRAYEGCAERIMKNYGLSLFVSERLSAIPGNGIIISRYSNVIPVYFKGLLITGEKRMLPFASVLVGEGVKAQGEYEALCPDGIDMLEFLSALCEVCFIKELRRSEYEKLVDISL